MIEGVKIIKLKKNIDDRGWLAEIFRQDEIKFSPVMAYISITKSGVIRGPHEHRHQSDLFIFAGPGDFQLHLWDKREGSKSQGEYQKISAGENNQLAIIVPPGIVHGYKCVSVQEAWCVNLPDKLYRGQGKSEEVDEIRWENQENSPYKIN